MEKGGKGKIRTDLQHAALAAWFYVCARLKLHIYVYEEDLQHDRLSFAFLFSLLCCPSAPALFLTHAYLSVDVDVPLAAAALQGERDISIFLINFGEGSVFSASLTC